MRSKYPFRMSRKRVLNLTPSLLLGVAIIASTWLTSFTAGSGWLVQSGPLLLAIATLVADVVSLRLHGRRGGPTLPAYVVAGAMLFSGWLLATPDAAQLKAFMPTLGIVAWVTLLIPPAQRDIRCR